MVRPCRQQLQQRFELFTFGSGVVFSGAAFGVAGTAFFELAMFWRCFEPYLFFGFCMLGHVRLEVRACSNAPLGQEVE